MMFKGAICLLIALCLVTSSEGKWRFKRFASKALKKAKSVGTKALKGAAQGALSGGGLSGALTGAMNGAVSGISSDKMMAELEKLDNAQYNKAMNDIADELSTNFKPDTVMQMMDSLDQAVQNYREDNYFDEGY